MLPPLFALIFVWLCTHRVNLVHALRCYNSGWNMDNRFSELSEVECPDGETYCIKVAVVMRFRSPRLVHRAHAERRRRHDAQLRLAVLSGRRAEYVAVAERHRIG